MSEFYEVIFLVNIHKEQKKNIMSVFIKKDPPIQKVHIMSLTCDS